MSEQGGQRAVPGIWVFAEQQRGRALPVGLEILGEARALAGRLAASVSAIVVGAGVRGEAAELIAHGADRVYVADRPDLAHYTAARYTAILVELAREYRPAILLLGATYLGRDLAPAVAARLRTGLCADCIDLDLNEEGLLLQIAPVLGGREMATMICPTARPQMATIRPGVFPRQREEGRRGEVIDVAVAIPPDGLDVVLRDTLSEQPPGLPPTQAEIVVAGGAGVAGEEGWALIRELAAVLGAAVGGTRPPLDEGFIREDQMIGQSGVTIRPRLYFAIGISGDIQHAVGFEHAGTVVAVNKDPNAPIFKVADYGIVGDYREIVPLLVDALRRPG